MADANHAGRRRRSSSLIYKEPPETIEQRSDQAALPNLNASWVNSKGENNTDIERAFSGSEADYMCWGYLGAWGIHVVLIIGLKIFYDTMPGVSQETSWTLTNISYMFVRLYQINLPFALLYG